ncbi:hypothetical protein DFH09DRAFT_1369742 [Mycena vulgaris]|nr:hypothetical protein DFH09DRAFT_1369742 [Mycena vulgaris]
MPTQLLADVTAAVKAYAMSPAYVAPAALPALPDSTWNTFAPTPAEGKLTIDHDIQRQLYHEFGKTAVDRCIFNLLRGELRGKPDGYLKTLKNTVLDDKILKLIMGKIHPLLLDKNLGRVDAGFYVFSGAYWEKTGFDDARFARGMGHIFQPLLKAGGKAYMASDSTRKPAGDPANRTRHPADLQYVYNARALGVLMQSPPQARNMYETESEMSFEAEEQSSFEDESETSVQVDIPLSAYQEQLVKSSPERVSPQVIVAPNSTKDIYDWEKEWIQSGILPESSPGLPPPPQVLRAGGRSSMGFAPSLELSLDAIPTEALPLTISPGAFRAPFALAEGGILRELESSARPPRGLAGARGGGVGGHGGPLAPAFAYRPALTLNKSFQGGQLAHLHAAPDLQARLPLSPRNGRDTVVGEGRPILRKTRSFEQ